MQTRRYDIDWLRVIAIGLLMIYHVAIVFQPWGLMIGFISNEQSWEGVWLPMTMLNVWRIPILFFISGMGVYFSFRNRNWKQLLAERSLRILVPFAFGAFAIVPLYVFILQHYQEWTIKYIPDTGHLWFLGNIYSYVLLALPLLYYVKKYENKRWVQLIKSIFSSPLGLVLIVAFFVMETALVKPDIYELYAKTWHGYILGLIGFLAGYCLALNGSTSFKMLAKFKWIFLLLAVILFAARTLKLELTLPKIWMPIESCVWIFSILGLGYQYLNFNHKILSYLSKAAYPVYILHMVFLGLSASFVLPFNLLVSLKFFFVFTGTITGSLGCYELIKRIKYFRVLFGIVTVDASKDRPVSYLVKN